MSDTPRLPFGSESFLGSDRSEEGAARSLPKRGDRRATDKDRRAMAQAIQQYEQKTSRLQDCLGLFERHSSDLLFRLSEEGRIMVLSGACKALLGCEPDSLCKRLLVDCVHLDDREAALRFVREVLAKGAGQAYLRVRNAQGGFVFLELHARNIPLYNSRDPEVVGLGRRASTGGDPVLGSLTYGIAHELNQPLSAINMAARACERLLGRHDLDKQLLLDATQQVISQAERAAEIVRRMRQLAMGTAPRRSTVNLHELVREALRILDDVIRRGNIATQLQFAEDLPTLLVDRIQISQVLVNLIRNAVEAMGQSAARVLTIRTTTEGREVWVSVSDTGTGLAPEVAQRLFQPYRTTKPDGMGLGLVLCRSILESHAGRLWVREQPPPGATFCFALPLPPENHGQQIEAHRMPRG